MATTTDPISTGSTYAKDHEVPLWRLYLLRTNYLLWAVAGLFVALPTLIDHQPTDRVGPAVALAAVVLVSPESRGQHLPGKLSFGRGPGLNFCLFECASNRRELFDLFTGQVRWTRKIHRDGFEWGYGAVATPAYADGLLFVLTDEDAGAILKLEPTVAGSP